MGRPVMLSDDDIDLDLPADVVGFFLRSVALPNIIAARQLAATCDGACCSHQTLSDYGRRGYEYVF